MPDAGGAIRLDERRLHPDPDETVAANGAALATLATVLGLDLACLTASVCGVGHLPGLLIHDSPKEADFHLFTGNDSYVWNNDRGDCASLWMSGASAEFDKACYSPNPPEGVVLHRSGDRLIPATATAAARRW